MSQPARYSWTASSETTTSLRSPSPTPSLSSSFFHRNAWSPTVSCHVQAKAVLGEMKQKGIKLDTHAINAIIRALDVSNNTAKIIMFLGTHYHRIFVIRLVIMTT